MSVVTPEIRFFADRHWLMAGDILLVNITSKLPYEWSNMKILFDHKSTFEIRYGPFDRCRVRLEFDGDLIHWTESCGWWHPRETTFNTDYKTTMRILFETGYDLWRKDNGIMDDTDKAIKLLNDSGIPAMRSSDSDCLIFEVREQTFRALIPDNPTHTASLPAVAVLVFLGLVVSALFPASYGWECCCCGETIIAERDSHPVPGLIAWARFRAHRLTKRHRINHKAWVEAGRPYIDWKPVA